MGSQTLATYTSTGISLSTAGAYQTPFTITQTGTVDVASGKAVYSGVDGALLLNQGTILAPANIGVYLQNTATVTNASGGTIAGNDGVYLGAISAGEVHPASDSESLSNAGLIAGTNNGVSINATIASVVNTGTISGSGSALYLIGGGYLSNAGTLFSAGYGVHWKDDPGIALTFDNTGTVLGARGVVASGDGDQTITNQNLIDGSKWGVQIFNDGVSLDTLVNIGTIVSNQYDGVLVSNTGNAAIFNQGAITGSGTGVQFYNSGTALELLVNTGTISDSFAGVDISSSGGSQTIINHGTIIGRYGIQLRSSVSSATTIENAGTIIGTLGTALSTYSTDAGPLTLIIDPGAVFIGSVTGAGGVLEFAEGTGSLAGLGAQFFDFSTFALDAGASWTVSGTLDSDADEVITGFTANDTIDITNVATPLDSRVTLTGADVLSLEQSGDTLNLTFSGDSGVVLTLTSDGTGGTDITTDAICYARGTRILTPAGEVPIEQLAIGDYVVTRFGGIQNIRWIGQQKFDWRFIRNNLDKIPVRIAPGALAPNMPARELAVSPGHSLLIGEVLVLARDLVNGATITQDFNPARDTGILEYYQLDLGAHDCVIAEGCWSETYADGPGLRAQFHNAADYPDLPPASELRLCAPRPEHGEKFAAALCPVIARAWSGRTPGRLEGWVERITDWRVEGWALDTSHPALPVLLDIWLGERQLGTALAHSRPRGDLAQAGKGSGRCAFSFASLVRLNTAELRVLRGASELPHMQRTRRMG